LSKNVSNKKKRGPLSSVSIISSVCTLVLCSFISIAAIANKTNLEELRIEQLILAESLRINEVLSRLLYKTEALAALVIQGDGDVRNFERVAGILRDNPTIQEILVAPAGVVSRVYPQSGNEAVLGLNLLNRNAGNKEAIEAKNLGKLVLGGPLPLIQGGEALVGRLPVYRDTPDEKRKFWGIISISLKFPEIMNELGLEIFNADMYAYTLWRQNPDTHERQVIASNTENDERKAGFIEKPVRVLNAEWRLRVWSVHAWYSDPENITHVVASLLISFLVFFVTHNNTKLKRIQGVLEKMARTDPLTGIFNRRHFMELARAGIEKSRRQQMNCWIIVLDIDKFKNVNDTYGHDIGDKIIIDIAARIQANIRASDVFARYGGEEFILFIPDVNKRNIYALAEGLRMSIAGSYFGYGEIRLNTSASFGIARVDDYDLERAIKTADDALYIAKREGRNKVVCL